MNKNFFAIDNNIFNLKLDSYEFQIYCYLVSCAGKDNVCWPSYNTIARLLAVESAKVSKIVADSHYEYDYHYMKEVTEAAKKYVAENNGILRFEDAEFLEMGGH